MRENKMYDDVYIAATTEVDEGGAYLIGEPVFRLVELVPISKIKKYIELYKGLDKKTIMSYVFNINSKTIQLFKDINKDGIFYLLDTKYIGYITKKDKANNYLVSWEARNEEEFLDGEVRQQTSNASGDRIIGFKNIDNVTLDELYNQAALK